MSKTIDKTTIGGRIKAARKALGMTQEDLAELMCTSGALICCYEKDKVDLPISVIRLLAKRHVISVDDFAKLDSYFAENEFYRAGENHYPKYHFLVNLLYYTGMRIGEAIALTYEDFEIYAKTPRGKVKYMRVSITKSYNSAYKLLKGTKNDRTRKIPLPEKVIMLFNEIKEEHLRQEGSLEDQIFNWEHNACTVMIKKACKKSNIREYTCHDLRHTYISNLIRQGVPIPVIEAVTGDTQETIFKRYAHMFEGGEDMVLNAMANL